MSSLRNALLLVTLATQVVACAASRPAHGVVTEHGRVWAPSAESAARLAQELERLTPDVRRLLGESRDVVPEVWLQLELAAYRWWAAPHHYEGLVPAHGERIHLRISPSGEPPEDAVLAHELTHLLLPSDVRLPWAVEEAVCDLVSHAVAGERRAAAERWWHLLFAWSGATGRRPELAIEVDLPGDPTPMSLGHLQIDRVPTGSPCRSAGAALTAYDSPTDEFCNRVERGLAFFVLQRVVERIGVEETLHAVRTQAQETPATDWRALLAAMADLPVDPSLWGEPILDALRTSDAAAALSDGSLWHTPDDELRVPRRVARFLSTAFPGAGPHAVHARGRLRVTLRGTSVSVPAADIPWLRTELGRAWAELADSPHSVQAQEPASRSDA